MKTLECYLEDSISQLIEEALKIKESSRSDFDEGKLFAYYEVISTLLNQAEAFNISDNLSGKVRNFTPESLL